MKKEIYRAPAYLIVLALLVAGIASFRLQPAKEWKLVWADEFNYTGLPDSSKWLYDTGGNGWGMNWNFIQPTVLKMQRWKTAI